MTGPSTVGIDAAAAPSGQTGKTFLHRRDPLVAAEVDASEADEPVWRGTVGHLPIVPSETSCYPKRMVPLRLESVFRTPVVR